MKKLLLLCGWVSLIAAVPAFAAEPITEKETLDFFQHFKQLEEKNDPSCAQLYTDDAAITFDIETAPGQYKTVQTDNGRNYKKDAAGLANYNEANNFHTSYDHPSAAILSPTTAKISAHAYDPENCYHDDRYFLDVEKDAQGQLHITREQSTDSLSAKCPVK